jgi:hypothetical protein
MHFTASDDAKTGSFSAENKSAENLERCVLKSITSNPLRYRGSLYAG